MKSKKLDQFYTNPEIAKWCLRKIESHVDINGFDVILEPSAGNGAFFNQFNKGKRIGIDLDPKCNDILKQDYLTFEYNISSTYIVIGNPPFGKNSSLAVKFFNYSHFAEYICFIVPKTFRKNTLTNRLNLFFSKIDDYDLPKYSFLLNNEPYDVPCCFQIWKRTPTKRSKINQILKHKDFKFVADVNDADFLMQRVGVKAGTIKTENLKKWSKNSHYMIQSNIPDIVERFMTLDFDTVKYNTAGNPSISISELIELYSMKYT